MTAFIVAVVISRASRFGVMGETSYVPTSEEAARLVDQGAPRRKDIEGMEANCSGQKPR